MGISLGGIAGGLAGYASGGWLGAASGFLSGQGEANENAAKSAQFNKNYALQKEQLHSGYQIAAKDLKAAGINPILAGKWGPASANPVPLSNFGNVGMAAMQGIESSSKSLLNNQKTKMTEVQTKIQQHAEEIITDFHKAWNNSGQDVTEWIANASWSEVGQIVGNAIGMASDQVTQMLKSIYDSVQQFINQIMGKNKKGPVKGDATHPTYQSAPMTGTIQR